MRLGLSKKVRHRSNLSVNMSFLRPVSCRSVHEDEETARRAAKGSLRQRASVHQQQARHRVGAPPVVCDAACLQNDAIAMVSPSTRQVDEKHVAREAVDVRAQGNVLRLAPVDGQREADLPVR